MKWKLIFEGDGHEEGCEFKALSHVMDMRDVIINARQMIRSRLKCGESVSVQERIFLERIHEQLYIEGLE